MPGSPIYCSPSSSISSELRAVARELNAELIEDRGMDVEADILAIIQMLFGAPEKRTISMKDIAIEWFVWK